jgi:hypothetical protein
MKAKEKQSRADLPGQPHRCARGMSSCAYDCYCILWGRGGSSIKQKLQQHVEE